MGKKYTKDKHGHYHCKNGVFKKINGTRAEVWHGTACKTNYGLRKKDLFYNKHGRIVSKKKHLTAKKEKRLEKFGFFAKKGKFGFVKKTPKRTVHMKKKHKKRTMKKKKSRKN